MSVRPIKFTRDGIEVFHDEGNHGGNVLFTSLTFSSGVNTEAENIYFVNVVCPIPECGSVSTHPIGGGAAPASVQRMFLMMAFRNPDKYGLRTVPVPGQPGKRQPVPTEVRQKIKDMIRTTDGEDRWIHEQGKITDLIREDA